MQARKCLHHRYFSSSPHPKEPDLMPTFPSQHDDFLPDPAIGDRDRDRDGFGFGEVTGRGSDKDRDKERKHREIESRDSHWIEKDETGGRGTKRAMTASSSSFALSLASSYASEHDKRRSYSSSGRRDSGNRCSSSSSRGSSGSGGGSNKKRPREL